MVFLSLRRAAGAPPEGLTHSFCAWLHLATHQDVAYRRSPNPQLASPGSCRHNPPGSTPPNSWTAEDPMPERAPSSPSSPLVGVVMGSKSDWEVMQHAVRRLREFEVPCEARVISAHRTPDLAVQYAAEAEARG